MFYTKASPKAYIVNSSLLVILSLFLCSCALLRTGESDMANLEPVPAIVDEELLLKQIIKKEVDRKVFVNPEDHAELIEAQPYYYREYTAYPGGNESLQIVLRETESLTAPFMADANIQKVRYVTELHEKKEDARNDLEFTRETGSETMTYELRNGKWMRLGSLFIVERSEKFEGGEWILTERTEKSVNKNSNEQKKSLLKRFWNSITGS